MDSVDETLATSASSLELEHYGVKGMKWGVRKQRTAGKSRVQARRHEKLAAYKKKYGETRNSDDAPIYDKKRTIKGKIKKNADGSAKITRVTTLGRNKRQAKVAAVAYVTMSSVATAGTYAAFKSIQGGALKR